MITDIGRENLVALACRTDDPGSSSSSEWYYDPISPTTDNVARIQSTDDRGWLRNRDIINGFQIIRLRRNAAVTDSVEGVFTCDIGVDTGPPISVGIYYANESHCKWNMLTA